MVLFKINEGTNRSSQGGAPGANQQSERTIPESPNQIQKFSVTVQFKVPSTGGAGAPSRWKDRRDLNCLSTQGSDTLRGGTLSNGRLRLVDNQNGGKTTPMSTVSRSADVLRCNALTPTGTLAAYVSFDNMVSRRSPDILCIVFEHPSGSD